MYNQFQMLNKVEIRGIVGFCRIHNVGNTKCANFSVATDYGYKDHEGNQVIETTCYSNR